MTLEMLKTEHKSTWGGSREGSGRKPRLQYEARELFNAVIDEEWVNITETLLNYVRKGDKEVLKWVIEQRIGRSPQSIDISARSAVLNINEIPDAERTEKVMEIARRVSDELKKIKTVC